MERSVNEYSQTQIHSFKITHEYKYSNIQTQTHSENSHKYKQILTNTLTNTNNTREYTNTSKCKYSEIQILILKNAHKVK